MHLLPFVYFTKDNQLSHDQWRSLVENMAGCTIAIRYPQGENRDMKATSAPSGESRWPPETINITQNWPGLVGKLRSGIKFLTTEQ